MTFDQLSAEFERSHFTGLAENTVKGHRAYLKHLKAFFGESRLNRVTVEAVEEYRSQRRAQPTKTNPNRTIKGATVNRELECLKCILDLAVKRKYIPENPAAAVKHFNELRERPIRRMLTVESELRILEAAPPSSGGYHPPFSDGRANLQRGLFAALGSSGFREQAHSLGQRCEDTRLGGTGSFV
jgi:site-specific recombinase XerD